MPPLNLSQIFHAIHIVDIIELPIAMYEALREEQLLLLTYLDHTLLFYL